MALLTIKNLTATTNVQPILDGINLAIDQGETHLIMGPNGSGKTSLAQTIMGNITAKVTGEISFEDNEITKLTAAERAELGIFLAFQNPPEIPGVNIFSYLRTIYNKKHRKELELLDLKIYLEKLHLNETILERNLNEDFSGGEKKKLETLQLLLLKPKLAILDELDSGLDIDALQTVTTAITNLQKETNMAIIVISHLAKVADYLPITKVHILKLGKIVKSNGKEILEELIKTGYAKL